MFYQRGRGVSEELSEGTLVSDADEEGLYQHYPSGGRGVERERGHGRAGARR